MQWHCHSCQRLLCPLCKLRRVHHGHRVLPIAQAYQELKVNEAGPPGGMGVGVGGCLQLDVSTFPCLFQDKLTKEVNFILANQEKIQGQISHLDDAIKQMEVNFYVLTT